MLTGRQPWFLTGACRGFKSVRMSESPRPSLATLLPRPWLEALDGRLNPAAWNALETWFDAECRVAEICPPRERLFAALEAVPPTQVRVVLLGQDPYPTPGVANGLAFSTTADARLPPSLRRLYEGLRQDVGAAPPNGDLSGWAAQGVLLLNTVLSVRAGAPNSHRGAGWEPFCRAILEVLAEREAPVVFLCLGRQAEGVVTDLAPPERHVRVVAPHPSPLTGRRFFEACERDRPFTQVNRALESFGSPALDWSAPAPTGSG